jgi:endonuclease YncB( thermonuclease family)
MAHAPRARLGEYREQAGAISFRITSAPDFSATIGELKRRVPQWARQYNARTREWKIKSEFRDVLEELFLNVPSLYASGARGEPFDKEGPNSQWLWMALVLLIVITGGALLWARGDTAPEVVAAELEATPRAAAPAAPAAFQPQPGKVTSIVNLRSGPGTEFAVKSKRNAGDAILAVARQQSNDGYWWLLLDDGAWVRSDLVVSSAAGELPIDLTLLPDTKNAGAGSFAAQSAAQNAQPAELQAAQATEAANVRIEATVTWVSDGDTVHVQIGGREYRVRYIGITAPARDERNYQAATDANSALVAGKQVLLVKDVSESDSFGRLLRYVYLPDGTLINEALVRAGWAAATPTEPDVAQSAALQVAEQAARRSGVGIWAQQ